MPQFTLGEIDDRVLDRLDRNTALYSTLQRYRAINDAIRVLNLITGFTNTTVDIPNFTVKGQLIYNIPPGIIFPLRVYFEGRQLDKVSIRSISMRFRNWTTAQSNQGTPVQRWIPFGLGMFGIHPTDSAGGNNLQVNGISEPPWLSLPDQEITIEDQWLTLIENLAAQVLPLKESSAIFAAASLLYQEFIRGAKQDLWLSQMSFPRYFVKYSATEQAEQLGDGK